jgi:hypothetical protein
MWDLTNQARGLVTDITVRLLQQLAPSFPGLSTITNLGTAGLQFEDMVTRGICGVIGSNYSQYLDSLWFEAKVTIAGNPVSNGFNCGNVNTNLNAARANARTGIVAPRPDFIIKNGPPRDTDRNPEAYLIGDFKITVKAARRSVSKNTNQWKATLAYARQSNHHQYIPVTLFFTFYGNRNSATDIAYIQRKALASANVRAEVTEIVSRI